MEGLFEYQKVGVKWMLQREHARIQGGFLCDEMGLGKTIQTLTTMKLNPVEKTLIIVPNSIVEQWILEIESKSDFVIGEDVVITTYSKFIPKSKHYQEYIREHWDRIILDEAHEIRSKKSKRFKCIDKLSGDIRWVLTGTPIYNKKSDYNALLDFVCQGKYDKPSQKEIMLRRTKDDVNIKLPTCHFENVELDMYPEEWGIYKKCYEYFCAKIKKKAESGGPVQLYNMLLIECLLRVRQLCVHPKVFIVKYTGRCKKFDTLLSDIRGHNEKSIVFCQFHKEMDIIQEMCDGIPTYRLDGSVPTHMRQALINEYKNSDEKCVLIIQIKTGGQGLNIQEATRVYIMSPSWNPATELQAIARSHRTGQTREVHVKKYVYITSEPQEVKCVDEAIVVLQEHKSIVCAETLNDQRLLSQIPVRLKKSKMTTTIRKIFEKPESDK